MLTAEELKKVVEPVKVIGEYVRLRKSGKEWTGCCPFHEDRTPSFSLNPTSGLWFCHGCGIGGDILTFVEKAEGLDFRGAFAKLAAIAGIPVESQTYEPTLEFKLSGNETKAFDNWIWLKKKRLLHRWSTLGDELQAAQAFIESFWFDENPDQLKVDFIHRRMNLLHEAKAVIEQNLDKLDLDPGSFVEPFLRKFYSDETVRELTEVA
jgi:DNA primase